MSKPLTILGIETSCDETAVSIVDDSGKIHANLVLSQLEEHRAFGGVVPEIAARAHLDHLNTLITAAMDDANITFDQLDGVAATCGPGLIGGVLVGMMAGKAIASARNIPFIAVNHLEGHALTPRLTDNIAFPYLLLLASGGHTQLLVVEDVGTYKRWGTTLDDAAGECFDKAAKIMGLPYHGGPEIQKIAATCTDPEAAIARFPLPRPMRGRKNLDFSFSGLKTAVLTHVQALPDGDLNRSDITQLAYAFQTAMADVMFERCDKALAKFKKTYSAPNTNKEYPTLVISGGVAANTAIRVALEKLCEKHNTRAYAPPLELCGDNAAMIAWAGIERIQNGLTTNGDKGDPLDFAAKPRWPLDDTAPPRHGAGVKA